MVHCKPPMTDIRMDEPMNTNEIDVTNYIEEPHIIIDSCFR